MNLDTRQETVTPEGGGTPEIEVENHSPFKKGLALFIGDDDIAGNQVSVNIFVKSGPYGRTPKRKLIREPLFSEFFTRKMLLYKNCFKSFFHLRHPLSFVSTGLHFTHRKRQTTTSLSSSSSFLFILFYFFSFFFFFHFPGLLEPCST